MNKIVDNNANLLLLWSTQVTKSFNNLRSLLTENGWHVVTVNNCKSLENYGSGKNEIKTVCLAIFNPFNYQFLREDIEQVNKFCSAGNSLLVASGDNENELNQTNLNDIVRHYGVEFNRDCVIRPNLYKCYHPKESLLEDFIVNRGFSGILNKFIKFQPDSGNDIQPSKVDSSIITTTRILYARGCTLKVNTKVSTIMLTSSKWTIPSRQAICSFYRGRNNGNSRLIAFGSDSLFSDAYIDKEDNGALIRCLLEFISDKSFPINISDAKTIEIPELADCAPDIKQLIDIPVPCLQRSEPLPEDKRELIDRRLFSVDNSMLPAIARAFHDLNVAQGPLTLIKADFDCRGINLEPAVHNFLLKKSDE